jgi:hypothetical protein
MPGIIKMPGIFVLQQAVVVQFTPAFCSCSLQGPFSPGILLSQLARRKSHEDFNSRSLREGFSVGILLSQLARRKNHEDFSSRSLRGSFSVGILLSQPVVILLTMAISPRSLLLYY